MADAILASSGIYAIRNKANNKIYIGSAIDIARRWSQHKWKLVRDSHHSQKLQSAWRKYGPEQFVFEIIERVAECANLISREQYWIDLLGAHGTHGYNMRPLAGSSLGAKESEKSKALRRAALTGKKLSAAHCAKISAGLKGKPLSEDRKAKISAAHLGKKKGPLSAETRAKMSAAHTGAKRKPMTDEQRANVSRAHVGIKYGPPSSEARANISAALKEVWRRKKEAQQNAQE